MIKYGILDKPSHNRVYSNNNMKIILAELEVASRIIGAKNIMATDIEGLTFYTFEVDKNLNNEELKIISRLSFVYGIFEIENDLLKPVKKIDDYFEDDIVTILKYRGKTNELFTKTMLNIAMNIVGKDNINLLDPICGKGTTLFSAISMGMNAYGLDINKDSLNDGAVFLKKYLVDHRYKHRYDKTKASIYVNGIKNTTQKYHFDIDKSKEEKLGLELEMIRGDVRNTSDYYKKNFFDVIVGDLPYGVQHGNASNVKGFIRNPKNLLEESLDGFYKVLKVNGVVIFAFNEHIIKKSEIADMFRSKFDVETYETLDFQHKVDQSILRNIFIGIKK